MPQPLTNVTVRRAFHRGIVVLADADPDDDVILGVHHANLATVSVARGTVIDDGADAVRIDLAPAP